MATLLAPPIAALSLILAYAASEEDRTEVAKQYMACLLVQAEQLDDGASDAVAIAHGITPGCQHELVVVKQVYSLGLSLQAASMLNDRIDASQLDQATRAVLTVRSTRRSKQAPPAEQPSH